MGNYSMAMRDAEQILEINPKTVEYLNLKGNIHMLFGEMQQAIQAYSEAIRLDENYAEAFYNRGLANVMNQNPIPGCNDLQKSKDLNFTKAKLAFRNYCGR
jgi:tetratricopeptide (TPR) repeat protein